MVTAALSEQTPVSRRDGGSFRDPSGYVFHRAGAVYRALSETAYADVVELHESGLLRDLQAKQLVVGTAVVEDVRELETLTRENPGYRRFLRHDRIEPITYPYEWTVSMVGDAAILTLQLQRALLKAGWSLKDATAYNIQFVGGRPIFIDITSIERPQRLDVWYALGQFSQMFLFPLILFRYHGWDFRSYYLGSLSGRDVAAVARALGFFERWGPRALFDVTLPLLFEGSDTSKSKAEAALKRPSKNGDVQLLNLDRLERKIRRLAGGYKPAGHWVDYQATCNYSGSADEAKKTLVGEMLEAVRPSRVLDVGCNTGDYSRLALARGAAVIAVDADHDVVDMLRRRLRDERAAVSPMVVNLTDPSPAIGFMNTERQSFMERVQADCVIALALLHHLCVTGNLSLNAVCDLFAKMTTRYLILEHVPPGDSMFQKLVALRTDRHEHVTLDACRDAFSRSFVCIREVRVPETQRTLLLLRRKDALPRDESLS
jgi:SAM-dependent methyltransferase